MTPGPEQRNAYKGSPPRSWIRACLVDAAGSVEELELLADTGSPCPLIIGSAHSGHIRMIAGLGMNSNFGVLIGGYARVVIPDIGFDQQVLGYVSDSVVAAARASSADFAGVVGLPFLRLMHYGGDADWFWIRPVSTTP